MLKTKRKAAVFTITKNEQYFLPIWLKYYSQHFLSQDIFVLDHNSTDGSTTKSKYFTKVLLNYDVAWDHRWMRDTICQYQQELLKTHETVLFAEVDEIIIADPHHYDGLQNYIEFMQSDFISTNSFNVYHNKRMERPIDLTKKILHQRKYIKKLPLTWGKPLLSKIPLPWGFGFHNLTTHQPIICDENLYLFHLRFMDSDIYFRRLLERTIGQNIKNDGHGLRNAIADQEVLHYRHHNTLAQQWWEQKSGQHNFDIARTFVEIPNRFWDIF